ncbi:hypothetical protein Y032_0498g2513 [Ancylostoma ceylanicum]|uniref:Uncharacterized protein n=1 Tax=Ancylostoma ceylanicum TaxID=53326 RepID=A0A016WVF3_9BILA|nr:hypothetical protein Y032_0498g2513 [Ancylostoma ceylanicum]
MGKTPWLIVPGSIPARAVRSRRVHFEAAKRSPPSTPTVNRCIPSEEFAWLVTFCWAGIHEILATQFGYPVDYAMLGDAGRKSCLRLEGSDPGPI